MKSYCLDQKGLSLIEVMISIVVLSFGLLGVAAMQVTAIQVNSVANKITNSSTILQDKIETLMSLPFNHADLSDATDLGLCEEHIEPSPPAGFAVVWCVDADVNGTEKTIDLRATWLEATKTKSFTLSFVRSTFHD